jgi:ribosomal-protein-serine acetyltransferase
VSNPEISKEMSWLAHTDKVQTIEFINSTLMGMEEGKSITWCIFNGQDFCGVFSLINILKQHRALIYNRAELAYWVCPEFEGQGIMTESGRRVVEFAFSDLRLHKLVVGHHINNHKSEKLILRLGFRFLYKEEEVFMKNSEWITCKFYELNSKEYTN